MALEVSCAFSLWAAGATGQLGCRHPDGLVSVAISPLAETGVWLGLARKSGSPEDARRFGPAFIHSL